MKKQQRLISYKASFEGFEKQDGFNFDNINANAILMPQSNVAEECARHFSHMNPDLDIAWPVLFEITDNSPQYEVESPSFWLVEFNGERYTARKG